MFTTSGAPSPTLHVNLQSVLKVYENEDTQRSSMTLGTANAFAFLCAPQLLVLPRLTPPARPSWLRPGHRFVNASVSVGAAPRRRHLHQDLPVARSTTCMHSILVATDKGVGQGWRIAHLRHPQVPHGAHVIGHAPSRAEHTPLAAMHHACPAASDLGACQCMSRQPGQAAAIHC